MYMRPHFKELRSKKKLTQNQVANHLGMTIGNYQKHEAGDISKISYQAIVDFCNLADCTPNEVFGFTAKTA